jgi:hypothetical protein
MNAVKASVLCNKNPPGLVYKQKKKTLLREYVRVASLVFRGGMHTTALWLENSGTILLLKFDTYERAEKRFSLRLRTL